MAEGQYISKWVTFAASAFVQASAGLSYSFSVYAPTIKDTLGLSQTQLATVGSAVNLGGYFAIISGSVYDNLKEYHRLGPRLVLWLGCLCCFCGYMGIYLMTSGKAPNNFPQLLIFAVAAGNMGTWFDTSALVTNVRNFPNDRGFVLGVLKSFLGLSGSLYTTLYVALFEPDAVAFLLMLAIVPSVLGVVLSLGLNYVPFVEASEGHHHGSRWATTEGRFLTSFLLVAVLALYQMASAVLMGQQELSQTGRICVVTGMAALLALSAGIPLRCGGWRAAYGHDYITTRESLADEEQGQCPEQPGSPQPVGQWEQDGRCSPVLLHSHATAHHRAVGGSSSSSSSSGGSSSTRPGRPVHVVSHGPAAGHRSKSPIRPGTATSSGGMARSTGSTRSGRRDAAPGKHPRLSIDDTAEGMPLLAAGTDSIKAAAAAAAAASVGSAVAIPDQLVGSENGAHSPTVARPQREQLHVGSFSTTQMLATLDFWLLFLQFVVAAGVCLAYLNNLGQLVVSLEGGHDGQVVFVSLFSVANAAGRLLMGYIPEQHLHSSGTPRTMFLTLTAAVTAASSLAVAYANLSHLYIISILLGMAFGAHWSLLPAITSDLFGLKHFAANYTTLQFAPAAGSYLLATRLTGWLYDRAAIEHGDPHQCIGPDCFREAFLLLSGLAALSSIACSIATGRSRRAYAAITSHLRQVQIAEGTSPVHELAGAQQ